MNEFERKPDGGLKDWIETHEAMGGDENDAELLCLLLELRRRRENQTALQRERDEAIAQRDKSGERFYKAVQYGAKLEAEIARRDAAAGEPVYQLWDDGKWADVPKYIFDENRESSVEARILYTAAQPALLPPECTQVPTSLQYDLSDAEKNAWISGANCMRNHAASLGAQPQKVVELSEIWHLHVKSGTDNFYPVSEIHDLLDAANVKYEVKK